MNNKPTIELPRLEGESARAYAARVEYVTMGAGRSFERLLDRYQSAPKARPTQRLATLKEWSTRYNWQSSVREYDDQIAFLTVQEAADQYRQDLEKHREKAMEAGRGLYTVAGQLIRTINQALANPRKIKGEDGKWYTIHDMKFDANTFQIAARAMQTALDLEAHALGVDRVLSNTDDSEQP